MKEDNSRELGSPEVRVALVGRPNVGKSTLFNRLIGLRRSVVSSHLGTTRDRIEASLAWKDRLFLLTDMAGLETILENEREISLSSQKQVFLALNSADILIWLVDGQSGVTNEDKHVATLLRQLHKPVIVAVNKCDHPRHDLNQYEFLQFGFLPEVAISALHARGIRELLQAMLDVAKPNLTKNVKGVLPDNQPNSASLCLSIVGRPNVGKSTLLNTLVNFERAVVSPDAGTTRDSVDSLILAKDMFPKIITKWKTVRLIDTAGIRRKAKIGHEVEAWSVLRTFDAIDASEVVLLLIDSREGLTQQDLHVAEHILDAGRTMVLLLNKWDLILTEKSLIPGSKEDQAEQEKLLREIRRVAPFLHWVQILFLSAKEKINTKVIGRLVLNAYIAWDLKVSEEQLKDLTRQMQSNPLLKNLQKITLQHSRPPVFQIHLEGKTLPHFSTNRLIENILREELAIGSTPIKIWSVMSQAKN